MVVGVMAGLMKWGAEWEEGKAYHSIGETSVYYSDITVNVLVLNSLTLVFTLGLMISSLSKHLNHGNNPGMYIFTL